MKPVFFLGREIPFPDTAADVLIVGSGAAGYNAAVHLYDRGLSDIAILTEGRLEGTSRNTGSDKQTYYKVACAGAPDSPRLMAETLFSGGSADGDTALCEAAHSLEEFFHLVSLGVPFPHNRYGEFPGYKTDHDPLQRASSSGPYTSRHMTEGLEREVLRRGIRIIDRMRVVKLLADRESGRASGLLCLELPPPGGGNVAGEGGESFTLYLARDIIFATGGPAGLYRETVYPPGQFGASGVLAREGVEFSNITEWQYGIGSLGFRWNLSGSYQQVIPRYVALDEKGEEDEFLAAYFSSPEKSLAAVFLKGYQWPFDPGKIAGEGSSLIDCAIYAEKHLQGKRIFLDFTRNPHGFDPARIGETAREYLERSGALEGDTPVRRLSLLNPQAYELYRSRGIDLAKDPLEIDVLPQHHNGGAAVDIWWESSLKHLFVIGECAGTHGVKRPGGSALNAGQVGGLRASIRIAARRASPEEAGSRFENLPGLREKIAAELEEFEGEFRRFGPPPAGGGTGGGNAGSAGIAGTTGGGGAKSPGELLGELQSLNTARAAFLRSPAGISEALRRLGEIERTPIAWSSGELPLLFRFRETLIMSRLLQEAIRYYLEKGGKSRGSYLILEAVGSGAFRGPVEADRVFGGRVISSRYDGAAGTAHTWDRPVRPLPDSDLWFERVWRDFREGAVFDS
jgi:succinate dehydrogenase/fumarate reductase flavoprotein subunit